MSTNARSLEDWNPFDPAHHRAQLAGVRRLLKGAARGTTRTRPRRRSPRVLDLGCGDGRMLLPLAMSGCDVTGVDASTKALRACRHRLEQAGAVATLIRADFTCPLPGSIAPGFDMVLCLGNTFMAIAERAVALQVFRTARSLLAPNRGVFVLDDFPFEYWEEIHAGHWTSGLTDDGSMQLVFLPGEPVFAFRRGEEVKPRSWKPRRGEPLHRLWSIRELAELADDAHLRPPMHDGRAGLIHFRNER